MSVLSREIDSYQRALEAYRRQQVKYNQEVDQYQKSILRDTDGNLLVLRNNGAIMKVAPDGKLTKSKLPSGKLEDYGTTPIPEDSRFSLLRLGPPTTTRREQISGVRQDPEGGHYYSVIPGGGDAPNGQDRLGPEWRIEGTEQAEDGLTYIMARDVPAWMEKPAEWAREFKHRAPDPTFAQAKKAGMPSIAQIEGGLISEVLRSRGAR